MVMTVTEEAASGEGEEEAAAAAGLVDPGEDRSCNKEYHNRIQILPVTVTQHIETDGSKNVTGSKLPQLFHCKQGHLEECKVTK